MKWRIQLAPAILAVAGLFRLAAASPVRVVDAYPGSGSGYPEYVTHTGGVAILLMTDPSHGRELWRSDGSGAGTYLLKDILAGSGSSEPGDFFAGSGLLYFSANDTTHGRELWRTDGSIGGTGRLADIRVGATSTAMTEFLSLPEAIVFIAQTSGTVYALYGTDGTAPGTRRLLEPIRPGADWGSDRWTRRCGDRLVFLGQATASGKELWSSDGTVSGTVLLKDIFSGSAGSLPELVRQDGDRLLFRAYATSGGLKELWVTDGTPGGTTRLYDSGANRRCEPKRVLTVAGDMTYLIATNPDDYLSEQLWRTDGTVAGTKWLGNLPIGTDWDDSAMYRVLSDRLFFRGFVSSVGWEPFRSDGTAGGTVLLKDIYPGTGGSDPEFMTVVGDTLYFRAWRGFYYKELYRTGTDGVTGRLADLNYGSSYPVESVAAIGDTWYYTGQSNTYGGELWRTTGVAENTLILKDIWPGTGSSDPQYFAHIGEVLLFTADDGSSGRELARTDGGLPADKVRAQTVWLDPVARAGTAGSAPEYLDTVGNRVLYAAHVGTSAYKSLRGTDGTVDGTGPLTDGTAECRDPAAAARIGDVVFLVGANPATGTELWRSDGTDAGTFVTADIRPGSVGSNPADFTVFDGAVIFTADDGSRGREVWRSDGSSAGTFLLADTIAGAPSGLPREFEITDGRLYFKATDAAGNPVVWTSDGTPGGTVPLAGSGSSGSRGSDPDAAALWTDGAVTYLRHYTPSDGYELWAWSVPSVPDPGDGIAAPLPGLNAAAGSAFYEGTVAAGAGGTGLTYLLAAGPDAGELYLDPVTGDFIYIPAGTGGVSTWFEYLVSDGKVIRGPIRVPVVLGAVRADLALVPGLNFLSLPFDLPMDPAALFREAGGVLYRGDVLAWDAGARGYAAVVDGFAARQGFWLYADVPEPTVYPVFGVEAAADLTYDDLSGGWNAVGSVNTRQVSEGGLLFRFPIWGWTGSGYLRASELVPGRAYWIFRAPGPP